MRLGKLMNSNGGNAFRDPLREKSLLGRLGDELAVVYHTTLQATLPAGLQSLVDKLAEAEAEQNARGGRSPNRC
jgi:uncharacterized protein YidB (DUF937 family)